MRLEAFENSYRRLAENLVIYGYVKPHAKIKVFYPKETLQKIRTDIAIYHRFSQEVLDKNDAVQSIEMILGGLEWIFMEDDAPKK